MCAHAVRVAVEKIPGVDSVRVSLNDGYADVSLATHNTVTVERVRQAIRKNGFSPQESQVQVRGLVVPSGGELILQVPGTGTFTLAGDDDLLARLGAAGSGAVTVEGLVPEGTPATLRVSRLRSPPP